MKISFFQILLNLSILTECILAAEVKRDRTKYYSGELAAINITSNFEEWNKDLAIMFYTPWCRYCKQLYPSWEEIAYILHDQKNLVVGKFNCESPKKNAEICTQLGVDRYPCIAFVGYGDFNQGPNGKLIGRTKIPQLVKFSSDLYPEAIYDWIRMLTFMSTIQRAWVDLKGFFHLGQSRADKKITHLTNKIAKLQNTVSVFGEELEKYKAFELFDSLKDNGDPFPLLAALIPDQQNLPFRVCVADMSTEYCKYAANESYCRSIAECTKQLMEPKTCRPNVCPFDDKRGCIVASTCLQTDVIEQYKEALKK